MESEMKIDWVGSVEELHKEVVYPTVLVRTAGGGGSGTIIYSEPHPDGEGYLTYCLTNFHVIEPAISFVTKYKPMVGRDVKEPVKEVVAVGFYSYRHLSKLQSSVGYQADIVHWDDGVDLALLELRERVRGEYVARLFPETGKYLYMLQPVIAVGCSLGHKPLPSMGMISSLDEQIENRPKFMSSACIIYGNSGGSLFTLQDREMIGVPCAGDVVISGFSAQMIPHLGYVIPYYAIYDFLREGCYDFIFDETKTYEQCAEEREEKMDELQQAWESRWKREKALDR